MNIRASSTKDYIDQQVSLSVGSLLVSASGPSAFSSTTAETSIQSAVTTVSAGAMKDGDELFLFWRHGQLNNSGSNNLFTYRMKANGSAYQTITYTQTTNAFPPECYHWARFWRINATTLHYVNEFTISTPLNTGYLVRTITPGALATLTVNNMDTSSNTFDFTAQMGTSNANNTITPRHTFAKITKN